MKHGSAPAVFVLLALLAGCAAFGVGGQVYSGRRALLISDHETALGYFVSAAQSDPGYVYQFIQFREGIWTYVGRTQYATKRYKEAQKSLERALEMDPDDNLARLYYGLTLVRSEESSRGVKEIQESMDRIHAFLEYTERTAPFQALWDPSREIRGAIEKEREAVSGKDFDAQQLIANAEWLGSRMEQEVENVRGDERRQRDRGLERGRGFSIGVGFGF